MENFGQIRAVAAVVAAAVVVVVVVAGVVVVTQWMIWLAPLPLDASLPP